MHASAGRVQMCFLYNSVHKVHERLDRTFTRTGKIESSLAARCLEDLRRRYPQFTKIPANHRKRLNVLNQRACSSFV